MSKGKTPVVEGGLEINIFVRCPNCDSALNIADEDDACTLAHDTYQELVYQVVKLMRASTRHGFKCNDITCGYCKTKFNVHGLNW